MAETFALPQDDEDQQAALVASSAPMATQPASMTGLQQQQPPPISGSSGGALAGQPPVPAQAPGGPDPAQAPAQGGPDLTKDMGTPEKVIQNKFSSHPNELADAQEMIGQRMDKARQDPVAKAQAQKMTMTMAAQGADPVKAADQLFGENGLAYIQIDREVEDWERANKGKRKKAIPSNDGPLSDAELNNLTADTGEIGGVSDSAPALSSEQAPPALDGEGQNPVPDETDEDIPRNKSWGKRIKARLRNVYNTIPEDEMGLFLMEFGMRAMMAGETMGTMGALGAAGSGALSSLQGRQTAAADRKLEAEKYADEQALEERRVSAMEAEAVPKLNETLDSMVYWDGKEWAKAKVGDEELKPPLSGKNRPFAKELDMKALEESGYFSSKELAEIRAGIKGAPDIIYDATKLWNSTLTDEGYPKGLAPEARRRTDWHNLNAEQQEAIKQKWIMDQVKAYYATRRALSDEEREPPTAVSGATAALQATQ